MTEFSWSTYGARAVAKYELLHLVEILGVFIVKFGASLVELENVAATAAG